MPEGVIRLKGTSIEIMDLCDGNRTIPEIIQALLTQYPTAIPDQIESEVIDFLNLLREKRVMDFE